MLNRIRRAARVSAACFILLMGVVQGVAAATYGYGPGGLPDLSAYPIGKARFETMADDLGSPVSLSTGGSNQVTDAIWWIPAQGYSAPAAPSAGQRATQAATGGFFSRLKSQAAGTVAGMVPGVGGVVAAQAANAVATSALPGQANGTAIPGWWCRAVYTAPEYRLGSISCSPHAYTPTI